MRLLSFEERIKKLNKLDLKERDYILYWMQSSHRVKFNLALDYSILMANKLDKPVIVFFGITTFPEGNERSYNFLFEGLNEVKRSLEKIGIKIVFRLISPEKGIAELSKKACLVVVDKGYLRILRNWYTLAAKSVKCPLFQVEDNAIIPVEDASVKEEYSAATFRPKVHMKSSFYLVDPKPNKPKKHLLI